MDIPSGGAICTTAPDVANLGNGRPVFSELCAEVIPKASDYQRPPRTTNTATGYRS